MSHVFLTICKIECTPIISSEELICFAIDFQLFQVMSNEKGNEDIVGFALYTNKITKTEISIGSSTVIIVSNHV